MVVKGHQEQVSPLQVVEQGLAPALFPHGITQWRAESIQDAGLQQELLYGCTLTIDHFFQQVIHHVVMAATERHDESSRILTTLQGEGGELQAGDPAFGPCLQERTLFWREWKPHHLDEKGDRFLWREPQISSTHFQHVV